MNVKLPSELHRLAPFIAVAVLAVVGLVLVTRGISGGGGAGANADEVLNKAFGESPRTAVLDVKALVTAEVAGAPQAARGGTYSVSGPVEESTDAAQEDKADVRIRETGAGRDVDLRMVSTGDRGYVRVGSRWYRLTPQQFKQVNEKAGPQRSGNQSFVSELGFDLEQWMQRPRVAGSAMLDGVDTHRITGDLNAAAMAADFEQQGAAGDDERIDTFMRDAQKGGTVSVFVGKSDGILRKADVTASYTGQLNERATMRLTFRFDLGIRDVNRPQKFVAPKSALPGSRLARLDRALLGSQADDLGLTGGKGKSRDKGKSQGGDGSSKGDSTQRDRGRAERTGRSRQAYINCVQQASDAAALEKCQALLPRR